jgi:hypothetical protein
VPSLPAISTLLACFEGLVEAIAVDMLLMRVKRSSVGSISSVASNLIMHPAIKKLPMNDFTNDSAVKFYFNRWTPPSADTRTTLIPLECAHVASSDIESKDSDKGMGQAPPARSKVTMSLSFSHACSLEVRTCIMRHQLEPSPRLQSRSFVSGTA